MTNDEGLAQMLLSPKSTRRSVELVDANVASSIRAEATSALKDEAELLKEMKSMPSLRASIGQMLMAFNGGRLERVRRRRAKRVPLRQRRMQA